MFLRVRDFPEASKTLFHRLTRARNFVRPIPWLDKLTSGQQTRVKEISGYSQYEGWKWRVDFWMRETPLVSLDTESRKGETLPYTVQVAFAHSLQVLIFRLDKLKRERPEADSVLELLPIHLVRHLRSARTIVLVSEDETKYLDSVQCTDIKSIFIRYRSTFSFHDDRVALKDCGQSGPAIISMVANDYSHKPMSRELAKRWFSHLVDRMPEEERRKDQWHGYSRWPRWRYSGVLYDWTLPHDVTTWYMVHDVWAPLSFVYMVIQRQLVHLREDRPYSNA